MAPPKQDELTLLIAGKRFRFWSEMTLERSLDKYATADFLAPYEADRKEFREVFRPFSYPEIEILRGEKRIFLGTAIGIEPEVTANKKAVRVSAYSKPGVLADSTLPPGLEREYRKMNLRDIANALTPDFGIDVVFSGDPGAAFLKQKVDIEQKVHDFIEALAQQRAFVMSSTANGELLIRRAVTSGPPRARLKAGGQPIVEVKPRFNVQAYYSEITGYTGTRRKKRAKHTERNPWLSRVRRPMAVKFEDVDPADLPEATRAEMGRMFGNAISWEVLVPTWTDPKGELWEENTTITLEAPDAMIYRPTELVVRTVTLHRDTKGESAQLDVVLPGSFTAEIPKRLPWVE
jgi:prophage tail gpP-like protein